MHHRIRLRLNPDEHELLIKLGIEANSLFSDILAISDYQRVETLVTRIVAESQFILKREWRRVKTGEIGFVLTKYVALSVLVAMVPLAVFYL